MAGFRCFYLSIVFIWANVWKTDKSEQNLHWKHFCCQERYKRTKDRACGTKLLQKSVVRVWFKNSAESLPHEVREGPIWTRAALEEYRINIRHIYNDNIHTSRDMYQRPAAGVVIDLSFCSQDSYLKSHMIIADEFGFLLFKFFMFVVARFHTWDTYAKLSDFKFKFLSFLVINFAVILFKK